MYEIKICGCDFAWVFHGGVDHEPIPVVTKVCDRVVLPNRNAIYSVTSFKLDEHNNKPCKKIPTATFL